MDGQAIFSYSGAFPPEPSAWEKYWLGWVTPITVPPGTSTLALPAASMADTVYRVPITAAEYFLVENRNRDPQRTGQTVTSVYNGVTKQQTFTRDTVGFDGYAGDFSALSGAVTHVTSLDWSLPGAYDQDGTWYDGGVLIWHIDEVVISQTIASDSVNANPARRGVNLHEADGSQDIGQSYGQFSAGSGSEAGWLFDYWYQGNTAPVYKNEFSATTFPNSNSNAGANSHVTIRGFSARAPRMTAVVDRGDASIAPLTGFPKSLGQKLPPQALAVGPENAPVLYVATLDSTLHAVQAKDSLPPVQPARLFAWTPNGTPALAGGASSGAIALAQATEGFFPGLAIAGLNGDGVTDLLIPRRTIGANNGPIGRVHNARRKSGRQSGRSCSMDMPWVISSPLPRWLRIHILFSGMPRDKHILPGPTEQCTIQWRHTAIRSPRFAESACLPPPTSLSLPIKMGRLRSSQDYSQLSSGPPPSVKRRSYQREIMGPAASGYFKGQPGAAFATADGYLYMVDSALNTFPDSLSTRASQFLRRLPLPISMGMGSEILLC